MKNIKSGVYTHNDKSYNFKFGTNISIADKARFVNSVVGLVVNDEEYNSVIRDLVFDFYTIEFFTDIDVDEFKQSPSFFDDVEEFLLGTNVIEIIKANALPTLFDELNDAVDKSIEYRTGIHPTPIADSFARLLSTLEKKINEVNLNNVMETVQKITSISGELTPESLINAYMQSDLHQKNLEEIAESKKEKVETDKTEKSED